MRRLVQFLMPMLVAGAAAQAQNAQVERIEVVEYGLYTVEGQMAPDKAPNLRLTQKTNQVPAKTGVDFGIRYKVVGSPTGAPVQLKIVTVFPPAGLRDPHSQQVAHSEDVAVNDTIGNTSAYAYAFEDASELVPGKWTFQVWYKDKKLAEQAFTVVKP